MYVQLSNARRSVKQISLPSSHQNKETTDKCENTHNSEYNLD